MKEPKPPKLFARVNTGNAVVDEFFRQLDARLAGTDGQPLSEQQRALLLKARPEMLEAALDNPAYFEHVCKDAMATVLALGKG